MEIKASIPLKPHLLRYICWKECIEPDEFLNLKRSRGNVGYLLGGLLCGKLQTTPFDRSKLSARYSANLNFIIDPRNYEQKRIVLGMAEVRYFNNFLHYDMHEVLMQRMRYDIGGDPQLQIKQIIYEFIAEIEAEDLITFEAINKANQRLRKVRKFTAFRLQKRLAG